MERKLAEALPPAFIEEAVSSLSPKVLLPRPAEEEEEAGLAAWERACLSLVRGPTVVVRPPASPTATRCWLDGDVLTDVLRAATATRPLAKEATAIPPLADLFRLSPMARRLNRAVGRHPGVVALYEKARKNDRLYS
jgi:hypothetical protein